MRILGPESHEISRELDLAIAQVDRVAQIDDTGVVGIVGPDGVMDSAAEPLVGASVTEGFAVEDVCTGIDFARSDTALEGRAPPPQKKNWPQDADGILHAGQINMAPPRQRRASAAVWPVNY